MGKPVKTIIELSGIDLDALTPDNFRDVTREAGKNPDANGVPRGYRLRILKEISRGIEGSAIRKAIAFRIRIQELDARGFTTDRIAEELGSTEGVVEKELTKLRKRGETLTMPPLTTLTMDEARQNRLAEIIRAFRESQAVEPVTSGTETV